MKIAILGSPDTILGFTALGLDPTSIDSVEQGRTVIDELRKSDEYGIVRVTEDWAEKLDQEMMLLEGKTGPAVIRIPAISGATGKGLRSLKRIVERAVGSDILG